MTEKGKNGFRPQEFVEFDSSMSETVIIFSSETQQTRRREANRERLEREQGLVMVDPLGPTESFLEEVTPSNTKEGVKRRRSGGGRHIGPRK